jgi:hypothetical protein
MTNVLRGISVDYQATIRSVEAKASVSGNAQHHSVLCGSEGLVMCRVIAANYPTMDVAPRESATAIHYLSYPPFETMGWNWKADGNQYSHRPTPEDFSAAFEALGGHWRQSAA